MSGAAFTLRGGRLVDHTGAVAVVFGHNCTWATDNLPDHPGCIWNPGLASLVHERFGYFRKRDTARVHHMNGEIYNTIRSHYGPDVAFNLGDVLQIAWVRGDRFFITPNVGRPGESLHYGPRAKLFVFERQEGQDNHILADTGWVNPTEPDEGAVEIADRPKIRRNDDRGEYAPARRKKHNRRDETR